MSDQVLEKMISSYLFTPQDIYSFGWQGGEPTLLGMPFFQRVVEFQEKHGKGGKRVANGLQTNATLLTEDMARLFKDYHFLLGVSIDGPEEVHNTYRTNTKGKGSHSAVLRGIELLQKHEVEFNALVLVSKSNVDKAEKVYNYLKELGIVHHQYIPCVEWGPEGQLAPFSITGMEWGTFLNRIFDLWWEKDTRTVSVRHFDAIVRQIALHERSMCTQWGNCTQYFVVEHNGDVYPCDFFVEKSKRLGNVTEESWNDLQNSKKYNNFGRRKAEWHDACYRCPYLIFCSGDCLKHRIRPGGDHHSLSHLCSGWRQFYGHTLERFEQISLEILNEQRAYQSRGQALPLDQLPSERVGWNSPCPCGSGKKYKDCHGFAHAK